MLKRATNQRGRKRIKAAPRIFKIRKELDAFLVKEAARTGKTYVDIIENGLELVKQLKPVKA